MMLIYSFLVGLFLLLLAGLVVNKIFSINDIVDGVFGTVRGIIKHKGYEPIELPDYQATLLHLGQISLTECKLFNLSSIYRISDVQYNRDGTTYDFQTSVTFGDLKLNCSYEASLFGLVKKTGVAVVNLPRLSADTAWNISTLKLAAHLKELHLIENGFIDIHLDGVPLDRLGSIIIKTINNLFKNKILQFIENKLKDEINQILDFRKYG